MMDYSVLDLDLSQVVDNKIPVEKCDSGSVYFLIDGDEIVYIGISVFHKLRIETHLRDGVKKFDSYFVLHVPSCDTIAVERYFIDKFNPKYNSDSITVANRNKAAFKANFDAMRFRAIPA